MLTLNKAIRTGRLDEFIDQEEKRGIGPADPKSLDRLLEAAIKSERSEDKTSRFASRVGLTGK